MPFRVPSSPDRMPDRMTDTPIPSPLADLVRRHDPDRFLTVLFAPAASRPGLIALYAFNYEVAKTRERVSEPMLGRIRLQWWRESLDAIYGGGPLRAHEILTPLAELIRARNLTREHFDRLIDAREVDLADEPPADLAALEAYAEGSSARLMLLALEVLGQRQEQARAAALALGTGYALAGLLRAVPFHARMKRLYLPADLIARFEVQVQRDIFEMKPARGVAEIAALIAERAQHHLDAARRLRREVPRAALPALLPGVLARCWLKRLRAADYDLFDPRPGSTEPAQSWHLLWAALSGRY